MSTAATQTDNTCLACGENHLLRPGNTKCGGCGMSIALMFLGRVLDEINEEVTLVIPACCGIVTAGAYPTTAYSAPTMSSTFGSASAFASGAAAVRDMSGEKGQVICWAGDGGTYDIGMASLSAAAERNDNFIYICYDNEIYGNTGGQRSSATPIGAKTTTTPSGKKESKKDIMAIMAAHRVPYAATLSIAHPEDFKRKIRTALNMTGFRFFLIHSPCPTGWKSEPADTPGLVRLAVRSGLFLLYEVFNGEQYRINAEPDWTDPMEYYKRQRRFPRDSINIDMVNASIRKNYERLCKLADAFPAEPL